MRMRAAIFALLWVTAAAEDAAQNNCAVPPERWDDDYCDSADGCDEPNTSACSTVDASKRFECPDEGAGATLHRSLLAAAPHGALNVRRKPFLRVTLHVQC